MYLVFNMQQCMDGVNQDCIAANTGEEWKCFMAQVRVNNTPVYVTDYWSLVHLPSHQNSNVLA